MCVGTGFYGKRRPGPDFINVVRVRILSMYSGSRFYWCSPGLGPDYINQSPDVIPDVFLWSGSGFYQISVQVRVRI